MKIQSKKKHAAFTLLEILFIVSLLAILMTIAVRTYGNAQSKTRDAKRVAALQNLQKALALYHEKNHHYPPVGGTDARGFKFYSQLLDGACNINPTGELNTIYLRFDHSDVLNGIVSTLNMENTFAPLFKSDWGGAEYACHYVIGVGNVKQFTTGGPRCIGDNCPDRGSYETIQGYHIFCKMEHPNETSQNDGGRGPLQGDFFEVFEPGTPRICIKEVPST